MVTKSFDPETVDAQDGRGVKRKATDPAPGEVSKMERHRRFLCRQSDARGNATWRPKPQYRAASKRWCSDLDNGVRVSTVHPGLAHMQMDGTNPLWANWRTWPTLMVAMDLGSDGVCGMHSLQYKPEWKLNIIPLPDPSHAGNCVVNEALKEAGLQQVWLLYLVDWNLPYGPDDEYGRMQQLREANDHLYSSNSPGTMALFQEFCPEIKLELEAQGVDLPGLDIEQDIWEGRSRLCKEGTRVNLNRFQGALYKAKKKINCFAIEAFERIYCGLELDFLRGRRFAEKLILKAGGKEVVTEGSSSTNPVRVGLEDRGIRSCCANNVAISCMVHSDPTNKRIMSTVVTCAGDMLKWHTDANRAGRSVTGWAEWAEGQINGDYMAHVCTLLETIRSPDKLRAMGFRTYDQMEHDCVEYEMLVENDCADIAGQFCLTLAKSSVRRGLWMVEGWPVRASGTYKGSGATQQILSDFKGDLEIWKDRRVIGMSPPTN